MGCGSSTANNTTAGTPTAGSPADQDRERSTHEPDDGDVSNDMTNGKPAPIITTQDSDNGDEAPQQEQQECFAPSDANDISPTSTKRQEEFRRKRSPSAIVIERKQKEREEEEKTSGTTSPTGENTPFGDFAHLSANWLAKKSPKGGTLEDNGSLGFETVNSPSSSGGGGGGMGSGAAAGRRISATGPITISPTDNYRRHKRLSSMYGDFTIQLEQFWGDNVGKNKKHQQLDAGSPLHAHNNTDGNNIVGNQVNSVESSPLQRDDLGGGAGGSAFDFSMSPDRGGAGGAAGGAAPGGELFLSANPKRDNSATSVKSGVSSGSGPQFLARAQSASAFTDEAKRKLTEMFETLDMESNGWISVERLRDGFDKTAANMKSKGQKSAVASGDHIDTMFKAADANHDGQLDLQEFIKFFRYLPLLDVERTEDADDARELSAAELRRSTVRRPSSMSTGSAPKHGVEAIAAGWASCESSASRSPRVIEPTAPFRRVETRQMHPLRGRVKAVAVSPNRDLYACADRDEHIVHLFDFNTGCEVRQLKGHKDSLLAIAFSPDKKRIATASRDKCLIAWDCTVGHELSTIEHPGVVTCIAYSFDGHALYSGCQDNFLRKFAATRTVLLGCTDFEETGIGVVVTVDTQKTKNQIVIATRSNDKHIFVVDANTLDVEGQLHGHPSMIWAATFSPDDEQIVSSCEKCVIVWSVAAKAELHRFECDAFVKTWKSGFPSLQRAAAAPSVGSGSGSPNKPKRKTKPTMWTTCHFLASDNGRPIVVLYDTEAHVFFIDLETKNILLFLKLKHTQYVAGIVYNRDCIICGDAFGNVTRLDLPPLLTPIPATYMPDFAPYRLSDVYLEHIVQLRSSFQTTETFCKPRDRFWQGSEQQQ